MTEFKIQTTGVRELQRSLKAVDKALPKGLKTGLNGVSNLIINNARPLIPKRSGRAAGSLRASSTAVQVKIRVGGSRAPYYPWLDFGGRTGIKKSVSRQFIREGRYLYPTLRKHKSEIQKLLEKTLDDVARGAGLDVD